VNAESAGGRAAGLTIATVEAGTFAGLAPLVIGRDVSTPLGAGSVFLSPSRRRELGVAPGEMLTIRAAGLTAAFPVAEADGSPLLADGFVAADRAPWLGVRRTLLLVGVSSSANVDGVAVALAKRLRQTIQLPMRGLPSFLTGRGVSRLFGSFRYIVNPDGTIAMDPRWVQANIRPRKVPILGWVRCHRLMLPQLARALRQIERAGLAGLIDVADFRRAGGCYVSRTMLWDPSNPPSMHAWGLAIDINVAANPYGARPRQDPRVVAAFERWGFRWGGRWATPDGMHFELGALLRR
jgi:hypothetical protein